MATKNQPDVTAAPFPVYFGGAEYKMRPLSDRDYEELDKWHRAQIIKIARESIPSDARQDDRDEIVGAAVREAAKASFMDRIRVSGIEGVNRLARLFFQGMQPFDRALTVEKVVDLLRSNPSDIESAMRDFMYGNTGINLGVVDKDADRPKAEAG